MKSTEAGNLLRGNGALHAMLDACTRARAVGVIDKDVFRFDSPVHVQALNMAGRLGWSKPSESLPSCCWWSGRGRSRSCLSESSLGQLLHGPSVSVPSRRSHGVVLAVAVVWRRTCRPHWACAGSEVDHQHGVAGSSVRLR